MTIESIQSGGARRSPKRYRAVVALIGLLAYSLTGFSAPLHSPAHAPSKNKAMFKPASVTPALPMTCKMVTNNSGYGTFEFTAGATKPRFTSLVFEVSPEMKDVKRGPWMFLASFGPEDTEGKVFAAFYSFGRNNFVRCIPTQEMRRTVSGLKAQSRSGEIVVNPEFQRQGARAWRAK